MTNLLSNIFMPWRWRRSGPLVTVVRLGGPIGVVTPLRPGISLATTAAVIERAFTAKGVKAVALQINSPGGSVNEGFAVWDQVKMLTSPVTTLVTGLAASMGSVLSLCAEKGRRFATPNARIMIHQPLGGARGQATDIEIQAREMRHTKDVVTDILVRATGKTRADIMKI